MRLYLVAEGSTLIFSIPCTAAISIAIKCDLIHNVHVIKLDSDAGWVVVGRTSQGEEEVRHTRPVVSLLWHNIQQVVCARQQLRTTLLEQVEILT